MYPLLLPFSWIYDAVTRLRNMLFDCGVLKQRSFPLPVIAVGNLAVGGTGKTPHTEYLLRLLGRQCHTAMLSRGYGRRSKGFRQAADGLTASDIGDEPLQMWQKYPHVTVAVDENRCEGIENLLALRGEEAIETIVLDDAYQHRYVKAGLCILLTDYSRRYSHDCLLPAGRLREARRGARRAQVIVVTKCLPDMTVAERKKICRELRPRKEQKIFFTTLGYSPLHLLFGKRMAGQPVQGTHALVITGIARPEPLHRHLRQQGMTVHPLVFPDHHAFTVADIEKINKAFGKLPENRIAVTTEKDGTRLMPFASQMDRELKRTFCMQPIEIKFIDTQEENEFNQIIIDYVTENKRNSRMD